MSLWFSSDLHFGHLNILKKFCVGTRLGENTAEMDAIIIKNIQNQVKFGDELWWLGDIFFCDERRAHAIMDQIPVKPNLIWGNHDQVIQKSPALQERFASIQHWKKFNVDKQTIVLHHFPTYEWDKMHRGAFHLYGHIHSRYGELQHPNIPGRCMDVGIDSRPGKDMTPWSWTEVNRILSARAIRGHHEKEL